MMITRDLGIPKEYVKITDTPTKSLYLLCGKPNKIKNLEENIGKRLEIDNKSCIITYPVNFLIEKGEIYTKRFIYTLEIIKNAFLAMEKWKYKDGKIT